MWLSQWMVFALAAVVTAGLCVALIPVAGRLDLVDHPGHRKVHESTTPLTGGPAIFIVVAALLAWHAPGNRFEQALLAGISLLFVVGVIDDRRHVSPFVRFLVQVAACLVMIQAGGVQLDDFGSLFTGNVLELGWQGIPLTIFAAMGVINAFNMIDGMDGLSGGIFLVAAGSLALYAGFSGAAQMHWLLLGAMSAVIGFMALNARFPWNEKARVFLGDSGSTVLGFILAWSLISMGNDHNETGHRMFMPMTAVWLIAVPLLDTSTQIWRRWRAGQSALAADQQHLHHAFLRAGYSVGETWVNMMLLAIALAGLGAIFERSGLPGYLSFWSFIAVAFAYYFVMRRAWRIQRFLGRDFIYNDFDSD